jgi:hypothetical protein
VRFQKLKVPARATALALGLALVGMLVTALPAFAAAPTITSLSVTTGAPGTPVTITGTNFQTPPVTGVSFNGTAAAFTVVSDTSVTTSVPCGATTGNVTVTNGTVSNGIAFTVTAAGAPTVTSFTPGSGTAGTTVVTITGTNLCGATVVKFNATNATTFTVNSATQITATVPTGATTGKISVTTPVATGTSTADFTVGPPTITSFTPNRGLAGTSVVITGTNFSGVTSVKFNGITATYTVNSGTQITATVPTGATTGPITVTNAVGTATGGTFTVAPPVVKHARSVSLTLRHHLVARGTVHVGDGFNACRSHVTVKIQRLKHGVWRVVGTDQTTANGKYKKVVKDRTGKYRAIAKKTVLNGGDDICVAALSAPRRHHH